MRPAPIGSHLPRKHERLAQRLEELGAAARPGRLCLAMRLQDEPLFLEYDGPGTLRVRDGAHAAPITASCLAKPLTATLLADAVSEGRVDWESPVATVLEARGNARNTLARITFRHLLDHTHGLDASLLETVPRTAHGFIDGAALCAQLAVSPLSAPGELYSYGNAGAWLAGAALEHLTGKSYRRLLWECHRIALREVLASPDPPPPLCPATGGGLALPLADWLSFAQLHASSDRSLAALRSSQAPLPGWSPSERAACLGWKYYGEGWFGHTANTATAIAFLRFHPADGIAIVMSATSDIALFAFSCLFRDYFPELKSLKFPRRLTAAERTSLRPESYVGAYAQARTRIQIAMTDAGRLSFTVDSDDPQSRVAAQILQPAENDIFFAEGKRTPEFPFIQLLRCRHSDSFDHAWNGKQLWRRQ